MRKIEERRETLGNTYGAGVKISTRVRAISDDEPIPENATLVDKDTPEHDWEAVSG